MIKYVSFIHPIQVGGDLNAIEKWQHEREGERLELVEKGPYIVLTDKRTNEQFRTPLSNVKYIRDVFEQPKKETK